MEVQKWDSEDQLDRSLKNEDMLPRDKEKGNIIHRKNVRTGHILHRNCLLNHVVEGDIERTVKRGSRCKHILGE
jgi:ACT domain-containing protein